MSAQLSVQFNVHFKETFMPKSTENSFDVAFWAVAAALSGAIVYLVLAM
jgi:hypothetical protein